MVSINLTNLWQSAYNVRDFGAKGDGNADDSGAFRAAFGLLSAVGGGRVIAPGGTYRLDSTIAPPSNCVLAGDGMRATVLKRGPACTTELIKPAAGSSRIVISDLTVDGNYPANTTNIASEVASNGCTDFIVQRVEVRNHNRIGIELSGTSQRVRDCVLRGPASASAGGTFGVWFDSASAVDVLVEGCDIQDYRLNGVFAGGVGGRIANCYFAGNHCQTSVGGGQIAWGATAGAGHLVQGCYFATGGGSATSGIEVDNVTDIKVVANTIVAQQTNGIILQGGTSVLVEGNTVKNSGTDGIHVNAAVSQFRLIGNRCSDDQGSPTQAWGINVAAGASDNYVITGNDLRGNVNAAGLSDNGTGTNKQVVGNLPLAAEAWTDLNGIGVSQGSALTYTTAYARAKVIGKTAHVQIKLNITSAGTAGNAIVVTGLPAWLAPKQTGTMAICGTATYLESGTAFFACSVEAASSSTLQLFGYNVADRFGITPAVTAASADSVALDLMYEVA